jgi:hypothetical protein
MKDEFGNKRFFGVYRGVVQNTADPLTKHRVQLKVPQVLLDEVTGWAAAVLTPGVTPTTPDIGSGVWVMFEGGDPSYPIWIGTF